jgi:hypothetical protein
MSRGFSPEYSLPELNRALIAAGQELYSFAMSLWGLEERAKKEVCDILLVALEHNYFVREVNGQGLLSHLEFREEFYTLLYKRAVDTLGLAHLPIEASELKFFKLPLQHRAMLYLKSRLNFDNKTLAKILRTDEASLRLEIAVARECLLGRKAMQWPEEIF